MNQPVTPEGTKPSLFEVWTIFHQLWADAHTHVYHKSLWQRMQTELQKVQELMTPTAEPAERIELGSVSKRIAREEGEAALAAYHASQTAGTGEMAAIRRRVEGDESVGGAGPYSDVAPASYAADMVPSVVVIGVDSLLRHLDAVQTNPVATGVNQFINELRNWALAGRTQTLMRKPPVSPKAEGPEAPVQPVRAAYAGEFPPNVVVFAADTLRGELCSMIEQESAYDQRRSRQLLQQLVQRIQASSDGIQQRKSYQRPAVGSAEQELRGLVEQWAAAELEKAKPEILRAVRRRAEDYVAGQKTASPSLEGCETT